MHAAELAHALGAVRSGRQWKCKCVAHEDAAPSMIIFDGREQVQVRCLAGCDQRDLIGALKARGLWDGDRLVASSDRREPLAAKVSHETHALVMRDRAKQIFDQAVLTIGTSAQAYLESRELWSVARDYEDIRFHPNCPRGPGRQPALVIAMRSLASRNFEDITGVQRIYLTKDARKDGAMMLGPIGGSAMMLWPDDSTNPGELHITEGLESALAVLAMDHGPVWAMGSCGAIERLPVIEQVDRLWIWGDHDAPGIRAADRCAARWAIAGRGVTLRIPNQDGYDPCDVWRARNARQ